ncbi:TetR/AcrR family transcriptional regulator [Pseudanabaena sp. PCC 6802]|uniref:TetR/AcrR family transcriptional regulator n=1 Tax=Pseudanabaena sp. PCC 6802 TaxID=118173 RepID=UPI00034C0E88|nr:TetR/AcrR family transcriptional regulator [Pseudanabaena sp. PCC 6802]
MALATRNTYHHGDLRQSLIDAAIALIGEEGIDDLSLRQVARRVGVSHNAPYRHFEDKEALLAAVAEQGFQSLRTTMETARQAAPSDPSHRLEAIGIAYVNFALANPLHYRLMFGDYRCNFSKYTALAEASRQAFMVLVSTIQEGQTAGIFRAADTIDMARVAWSLVHGQSTLALDNKLQVGRGEELEAFLRFSSQMLINGLAGMICNV